MSNSVLLKIDSLIFKASNRHLNSLQRGIIYGLLADSSYREIADKLGYDEGYIGDKARQVFKVLSKATGETVNKSNFSWVVERLGETKTEPKEIKGKLINSKGEISQIKVIESDGIVDILLIGDSP